MELNAFLIPAFIAGVLTFLAPCTLPLIPGYLSFISGASRSRGKVFLNGVLYMIGFSAVFIFLGSLFGLGGAALFEYRPLIRIVGGIFVILFGLFLLLPENPLFQFLLAERKLPLVQRLKPGNPFSSLLFGATFAFGWSPCVGPIVGSVLTLAASSATVGAGALLLAVFSLGLALPFLATALAVDRAVSFLPKAAKYLRWASLVGGLFIVFLGILMVTNSMALWIGWVYRVFDFINYDVLIDYL